MKQKNREILNQYLKKVLLLMIALNLLNCSKDEDELNCNCGYISEAYKTDYFKISVRNNCDTKETTEYRIYGYYSGFNAIEGVNDFNAFKEDFKIGDQYCDE